MQLQFQCAVPINAKSCSNYRWLVLTTFPPSECQLSILNVQMESCVVSRQTFSPPPPPILHRLSSIRGKVRFLPEGLNIFLPRIRSNARIWKGFCVGSVRRISSLIYGIRVSHTRVRYELMNNHRTVCVENCWRNNAALTIGQV